MASGIVRIEGKEISLDQQIIDAGIPAIRAALSVDFADVENADIEIVTPGGGAPKVATVVKRGTGKGIEIYSSRKLPEVKGGTAREHLEREARQNVDSLFRRIESSGRVQAVLTIVRTACACGDLAAKHPDNCWIVVTAGPFTTPEEALNALAAVAKSKPDVLKRDELLNRPFSGIDITGGSN
jgi:hypothetical protein